MSKVRRKCHHSDNYFGLEIINLVDCMRHNPIPRYNMSNVEECRHVASFLDYVCLILSSFIHNAYSLGYLSFAISNVVNPTQCVNDYYA